MKFVACLVLVVVLCGLACADDKYTEKYDDFDIDGLINNKRLLENYAKCLLNDGPCTKEGEELKGVIRDALADNCEKCNVKQKASSKKMLKHLIANEPEIFKKLLAEYDKDGEFMKKYKDEYAAYLNSE